MPTSTPQPAGAACIRMRRVAAETQPCPQRRANNLRIQASCAGLRIGGPPVIRSVDQPAAVLGGREQRLGTRDGEHLQRSDAAPVAAGTESPQPCRRVERPALLDRIAGPLPSPPRSVRDRQLRTCAARRATLGRPRPVELVGRGAGPPDAMADGAGQGGQAEHQPDHQQCAGAWGQPSSFR